MAKQSRRISELRALVLGEISSQAACPPGMDVFIRPTEAGDWRADAIPPSGSIAYADCVDFITQVASRLREQYEIAQEPAEGLFNSPFGESTFNVADATQRALIDWGNAEEREVWFGAQPRSVAWVMAARAALRILPTMSLAVGRGGSRLTRRRMILRVFRATASSWAISAYPSHRDQLLGAAPNALSGLGSVQATIPERAAVYSLATVLASGGDVAARASTAIGYALDAAGRRGAQPSTA